MHFRHICFPQTTQVSTAGSLLWRGHDCETAPPSSGAGIGGAIFASGAAGGVWLDLAILNPADCAGAAGALTRAEWAADGEAVFCRMTALASSVASAPQPGHWMGTGMRSLDRLDLKFKARPARALDFDLHVQGLGLSRTTPGAFVKLNADCGGLDWMLPSQNITLPPYLS